MSSPVKRKYDSKGRKAQAENSRKRVLEEARALFQQEGFERVTIEKVAQNAQVSPPTVYALFQSKLGILRALMDEVLPTEEFEALVLAARFEKSPTKRLALSAQIACRMYAAERAEMEFLRSAAMLAPEFRQLEKEREERRYARQEETIQAMFTEGSLQISLSRAEARDILWAFTGRDMYRLFVIERGWPVAKYEAWLTELLIKCLVV
jgi:AcrR family transcriptional regulator